MVPPAICAEGRVVATTCRRVGPHVLQPLQYSGCYSTVETVRGNSYLRNGDANGEPRRCGRGHAESNVAQIQASQAGLSLVRSGQVRSIETQAWTVWGDRYIRRSGVAMTTMSRSPSPSPLGQAGNQARWRLDKWRTRCRKAQDLNFTSRTPAEGTATSSRERCPHQTSGSGKKAYGKTQRAPPISINTRSPITSGHAKSHTLDSRGKGRSSMS